MKIKELLATLLYTIIRNMGSAYSRLPTQTKTTIVLGILGILVDLYLVNNANNIIARIDAAAPGQTPTPPISTMGVLLKLFVAVLVSLAIIHYLAKANWNVTSWVFVVLFGISVLALWMIQQAFNGMLDITASVVGPFDGTPLPPK